MKGNLLMTENKEGRVDFGKDRYLMLATVILVYLVIVFGGIVRVTGASGACPGWPTCNGQWLPPMEQDALLAYLHRFLTVLSAPLVWWTTWVGWRRYRELNLIRTPLTIASVLIFLQSLFGAWLVLGGKTGEMVAFHFAFSLLTLATLIVPWIVAFNYHHGWLTNRQLNFKSRFSKETMIALFLIFVVLVMGAWVAGSNSTYACSGWPLCNGELIPSHPQGWIHMVHRFSVALASIYMVYLLRRAWLSQRTRVGILTATTTVVGLYFGLVQLGALQVMRKFPLDLLGLHQSASTAAWGAAMVSVVLVGLAGRTTEEEREEAAQPIVFGDRIKDLLILTKPIIVVLLLVTTYTGMVVAGKALPGFWLTFWTLLGGGLAAGGSGAVNQYIDREVDQRMARTAKRPIASGRITPAEGVAYGVGLLIIAFFMHAGFVNLLTALLSLAGMLYYVVLYSLFLKYTTVQNIVIGGGAGAIPPLVGWAAVTGNLSLAAMFLFAIIFMWTPPHFWALALVREKDYARAGIPMLPVIKGKKETRRQVMLYTIVLVPLTLLMWVFNFVGMVYLISATLLGAYLIYWAWRVWKEGGNKIAWRMYKYSSYYLLLLFIALIIDALV